MLASLLVTLGFGQLALCGFYNWDITWVNAAPDGFSRPVIGINGKWPPPVLEADVGEKVTVNVRNKLGNETTSIHWHGLRQLQNGEMDGPTAVTQCPIPPDSTFRYTFTPDQPGTYWYHSHDSGQYPDGLRGVLIVKDKKAPWKGQVEKEYTITLSDWYHDEMPILVSKYQSKDNTAGTEPIPNSVLINDGKDANYTVKAGKTYLFRILNIGAFPSFFFNIQDHDLQVVEMDGVYTESTTAKTLYIGAAQRYTVLVTAKNTTSANFDISALVDTSMFRPGLSPAYSGNPVASGTLSYSTKNSQPARRSQSDLLPAILPPIDDLTIPPLDGEKLLGPVTKQIVVNFDGTFINGIPRAIINNVTWLPQKVPSLYTAVTVGQAFNMDPKVYGVNSNPFAVNYGDVVEVIINNLTPQGHPWHLHGHQFQTVARSDANVFTSGGKYDGTNLPSVPMRRDVAGVRNGGYLVIRFKADNPGVQLLHCHIEWHVDAGLTATIIEAADKINFTIPQDHLDVCKQQNIPTQGNAAGNTRDPEDLSGANTQVPQTNDGAVYTANKKSRRMINAASL